MGLVTHEMPHLTARGPVPYPGDGSTQLLEQGMVLSIETTLRHSTRGVIKLEDTVVVTDTGHEIFGNASRGWNKGSNSWRTKHLVSLTGVRNLDPRVATADQNTMEFRQ